MTQDQFKTQIERLRTRFGEKAFDAEIARLIWREVDDISLSDFMRIVDTFIGSRPAHKAPLLAEFKEARHQLDQARFAAESRGAAKVLTHPAVRRPLADILGQEFGKVESVSEALEIARLKRMKEQEGK